MILKKLEIQQSCHKRCLPKAMGVSIKTVEAWESGRNHPDGAATRLLSLIEENPKFLYEMKIIKKTSQHK